MNRLLLVLGIVGLSLISCKNKNSKLVEEAPLISQTVTDDLGREIKLSGAVKKLVSLAPSVTEIVFAIGGEQYLAARSHACNYPQEVANVPAVQTYPELDLPGIVSQEPDLIVGTSEIHNERITRFFESHNLPFYLQTYENLKDVYRGIRDMGKLLDLEDNAEILADSLEQIEAQISDSTQGLIKYKTLVLISVDPLLVVGGKSYLNEMVEKAGGKNAFAHLDEKYPEVSVEAIVNAAPEFLIFPSLDEQIYPLLTSTYPVLYQRVPAIQNNSVRLIDPDFLLRPGPRIVEGIAYLAKAMHSGFDVSAFFPYE